MRQAKRLTIGHRVNATKPSDKDGLGRRASGIRLSHAPIPDGSVWTAISPGPTGSRDFIFSSNAVCFVLRTPNEHGRTDAHHRPTILTGVLFGRQKTQKPVRRRTARFIVRSSSVRDLEEVGLSVSLKCRTRQKNNHRPQSCCLIGNGKEFKKRY